MILIWIFLVTTIENHDSHMYCICNDFHDLHVLPSSIFFFDNKDAHVLFFQSIVFWIITTCYW